MRHAEGATLLWSAEDALVMKATANVLSRFLAPHLSSHCYHLAGRGGLEGAVRAVAGHLPDNRFVFRTDVKGYYEAIDQDILFEQLRALIPDARVVALLHGYLRCSVDDGGIYRDINQGITRGCPLSPLMSALYLKALDDRMAAVGVCYVRFMDDWVILAHTRWKLRSAIKAVNQILAELKLTQHPDKTFIGRIERGFDFLGYAFSAAGLGVAAQTVKRFAERLSRLYEQDVGMDHIGAYVRRWVGWVGVGRPWYREFAQGTAAGAGERLSADRRCYIARPDP